SRSLGRDRLFNDLNRNDMAFCELLCNLAVLINIRFQLEFFQSGTVDLLAAHQFRELLQRTELRAKVKVMKESVLVVSYINEGGIESLNYFLYRSKVYVAYTEFASFFLLVKFYKRLIF